jgi:hypothetical protein
MRITITKEDKGDRLDVVRHDGTRVMSRFPRKGPTPHDAVHFLVEQELNFHHGFWGLVAGGLRPEDIADLAKAAGHASAKRATTPDGSIVELLQAERLVECFEASLWDGQLDLPAFRMVAQAACESSQVPLPLLDDAAIERVVKDVSDLAARWGAAPVGERLELEWAE